MKVSDHYDVFLKKLSEFKLTPVLEDRFLKILKCIKYKEGWISKNKVYEICGNSRQIVSKTMKGLNSSGIMNAKSCSSTDSPQQGSWWCSVSQELVPFIDFFNQDTSPKKDITIPTEELGLLAVAITEARYELTRMMFPLALDPLSPTKRNTALSMLKELESEFYSPVVKLLKNFMESKGLKTAKLSDVMEYLANLRNNA